MRVGNSRWPLQYLSSPLCSILWHLYLQPVHSSMSCIHCLLGLTWCCNLSMIPSRTVSANCPALPWVMWPKYCSFSVNYNELCNYWPISNLSLLSKIIERVVKARLSNHLTSNNLLNPSLVYSKHHSTETALLYIHDHLINAIGSRQISCLSLLCLSAAFDTIDHNILLVRHLGSAFKTLR